MMPRMFWIVLLMILARGAMAAYPEKPIRLVVPWAAGGSTDALARAVAQSMSESMGQPVVVDNRTGAAGRIGAEFVAKSSPDGYTLGVVELAHTVAPSVFRQMPYDILRDFAPVSLLGEAPLILFADSAHYRSGDIQRFLSDSRKSGVPLQLATSGNGTPSHLTVRAVGIFTVASTRRTLTSISRFMSPT